MNKNGYGHGYMNDSDFSKVSGGMSKGVKIALASGLAAFAVLGAYGGGVIFDKKNKNSESKGWGDSFKHPWGLFRGKKESDE